MYRKHFVILSIIALACIGHAQNRAASEAYVTNRVNLATSAVFRAAASLATQTVNDAIAAIPPVVETDAAALAALATNRVTVVWDTPTSWRTFSTNVVSRWDLSVTNWYLHVSGVDEITNGIFLVPDAPYVFPSGEFDNGLIYIPGTEWTVHWAADYIYVNHGTPAWFALYSGYGGTYEPGSAAYTNLISDGGTPGTVSLYRTATPRRTDYPLTTNAPLTESSLTGLLSTAAGDARYLSSTPGWFLQGSQVISTNTWTTNLTGYAAVSNGMIALVPYTTSRHDTTGTVTVVAQRYIVGVSAAWSMALSSDPTMPRTPMAYRVFERLSPTSFVAAAWCSPKPADANPYYWAYVSNIIVQTYDRDEMSPNSYTNDQAGIVARVDSLPTSGGVPVTSDGRAVVNAESMRLYVDARKEEIAKAAYRYTPSGRPSPSPYTFTVDLPLVQQGQTSYLQSGDYWCQSYEGGDWSTAVVGGEWSVGASGSKYFSIMSTNRQLHVKSLIVSGGYATIDISTNWVVNAPVIEFTDALDNQQWLECPAQTMTDNGSYWRGVCPAVAEKRFFRAVDRQGSNKVISRYVHEFPAGVKIGTNTFTTLSELKAQLEALP